MVAAGIDAKVLDLRGELPVRRHLQQDWMGACALSVSGTACRFRIPVDSPAPTSTEVCVTITRSGPSSKSIIPELKPIHASTEARRKETGARPAITRP